MHHLRAQVGDRLATVGGGYQLVLEDCSVDAHQFEERVAGAKDLLEVDPRRASELLPAALADRAEADLALGRHHELVGELTSLTHEHLTRANAETRKGRQNSYTPPTARSVRGIQRQGAAIDGSQRH